MLGPSVIVNIFISTLTQPTSRMRMFPYNLGLLVISLFISLTNGTYFDLKNLGGV